MVSGQNLIVGWDQALFKFVDLAAFYVLFVSCKLYVNPISNCETLGLQAPRANGQAGRHQRSGHGYESSSMISSELETTSCLDSEDDATSRITTTTGWFLLIMCAYLQTHSIDIKCQQSIAVSPEHILGEGQGEGDIECHLCQGLLHFPL